MDRYVNLSISSLPSLFPVRDGERNVFGDDLLPRVGVVTEHELHDIGDVDHDERARDDDQTAAPFNAQRCRELKVWVAYRGKNAVMTKWLGLRLIFWMTVT